jgi:hypothetical protein
MPGLVPAGLVALYLMKASFTRNEIDGTVDSDVPATTQDNALLDN